MAKLCLESAENDFLSYNSFVLDTDNEWKRKNQDGVGRVVTVIGQQPLPPGPWTP